MDRQTYRQTYILTNSQGNAKVKDRQSKGQAKAKPRARQTIKQTQQSSHKQNNSIQHIKQQLHSCRTSTATYTIMIEHNNTWLVMQGQAATVTKLVRLRQQRGSNTELLEYEITNLSKLFVES